MVLPYTLIDGGGGDTKPIQIITGYDAFNNNNFHGYRRGRMWRFLDDSDYSSPTDGGGASTSSSSKGGASKTFSGPNNSLTSSVGPAAPRGRTNVPGALNKGIKNPEKDLWFPTSGTGVAGSVTADPSAKKWGFQFLWNPDTFNVSLNLNTGVTPSSQDRGTTIRGAFPGMESLSFSIVIDRTNDFACFKALPPLPSILTQYKKFYRTKYPEASQDERFEDQLAELIRLGTMHDIEYLFKVINGDLLIGNTPLTNLLGKKTADVGFLSPAKVAIQLGPTLDNLSYVGWVNSLSISHTAFTEDMIPIRTTVSFSMSVFASAGYEGQDQV